MPQTVATRRAPLGAQLSADAGDVAVDRARVALLERRERVLGELRARDGASLPLDEVSEQVELVARQSRRRCRRR